MKKMNLFNIIAIAAMSIIIALNGAETVNKEAAKIPPRELIYLKHIAKEKGLTSAITEPIKEYLKLQFSSIKVVNKGNEFFRLTFVDNKGRIVASTENLAPCNIGYDENCEQTISIPRIGVKLYVSAGYKPGPNTTPKMKEVGYVQVFSGDITYTAIINIEDDIITFSDQKGRTVFSLSIKNK